MQSLPKVMLVTHYPPNARNGSTHHVLSILEKYSANVIWYSTKPPNRQHEMPDLSIPYMSGAPLTVGHRRVWKSIRRHLNLTIWAYLQAYKGADFARSHGVELVWTELNLEAIVAGPIIANILQVPLVVSVPDDPLALFQLTEPNNFSFTRLLYEKSFRHALRKAEACAVISKPMAELFRKLHQLDAIVLYRGIDEDHCLEPPVWSSHQTEYVISSVGSVVAHDNWNCLVSAVRILNKKHSKRNWRILHIGELPGELRAPEVEVAGWITGAALTKQLRRSDLSFLNLWFSPEYKKLSQTSFPTKVQTYVQAQRPIVAFGPNYSSVVRFVDEHRCGITCVLQDETRLAEAIETITTSQGLYNEALEGIVRLKADFSINRFYEQFETFILSPFITRKQL